MKILYLCADPGVPVFGRKGCSTHVRENCLTFLRMNHELKLVCTNDGGDDESRGGLDIVPVPPYRSRKLGFDVRHILNDRRIRSAARRMIEEWRPDAVYERYSLYSSAGVRLISEFQLPHLLEVNAFMTWEQKNRIKLMPLARLSENRIFRRARHVVVVSDPLFQRVAQLRGGDRTVTRMPMGVNVHQFTTQADGSPVRTEHNLEGRFVIGYVGTLTGWHGINLLYDLARQLKESAFIPFAILVVGGDSRRLEANRGKVADQGLGDCMRFIGNVSHASVPAHIRAMDVALVPDTTYWSSPAKLFEYQGCGVPVVAPRYPAVERAMTHGGEGLIFEPRNIEDMARRIQEIAGNPEMRVQMARRGRQTAVEFHSWEAQAESVIQIFENQRQELSSTR